MQAFLSAYEFGHIPFCECCQEHAQFTAIGLSRPTGAVTFDNPNSSIDLTMIANKSEIKLICTRCGNQMYRFNDRTKTTYGEASPFLKGLFSRAEIQTFKGSQSNDAAVGGTVFFVFGGGIIVMGFVLAAQFIGTAIFLWLVGLVLGLLGIALLNPDEAKIEKLEPITIKDPNGQPFTFDPEAAQKNGQ